MAQQVNGKGQPLGGQAAARLFVDFEPVEPSRGRRMKPTDDELSSDLALRMGHDWRFFRQFWHHWDGGRWVQQKNINRLLKAYMIERKGDGINPTRNKASSIEWFLQADMELEDESLVDNAPHYVNLRNGLFNLDTLALEPHRREVLLTHQLDFDYDPDADAPSLRKFLRTALTDEDGKPDGDMQMLFLEALGYTLTADTSRKTSFWLLGESGSGKSTALAMLRALMGNMHTTVDLNQLATNRFLLAGVAGKRCITCTESNAGAMLADGLYKTLVGGEDEVQADIKNREPITFVPQAKVWWAMNELPRVMDRSDGVYGRVLIFNFRRAANVPRNLNLINELREQRAGIFNLALIGLHRLRSAGKFTEAQQVIQAREQYRLENDTEAAFVDENCISGTGEVRAAELYTDYKYWCEANGFRPKNRNQVAKEWTRFGFEAVRRKDGMYYRGLRLKKVGTSGI